jgi:chromosome segregation ATPase
LKAQLRDFDEKIHIGKSDLSRLKNENERMENELKNFENKVPIDELESSIDGLKEDISGLTNRLNKIKSSNVQLITKEEKVKVRLKYTYVLDLISETTFEI